MEVDATGKKVQLRSHQLSASIFKEFPGVPNWNWWPQETVTTSGNWNGNIDHKVDLGFFAGVSRDDLIFPVATNKARLAFLNSKPICCRPVLCRTSQRWWFWLGRWALGWLWARCLLVERFLWWARSLMFFAYPTALIVFSLGDLRIQQLVVSYAWHGWPTTNCEKKVPWFKEVALPTQKRILPLEPWMIGPCTNQPFLFESHLQSTDHLSSASGVIDPLLSQMAKCAKSRTDPRACENLHRYINKNFKQLPVKVSTVRCWIRTSQKKLSQTLTDCPVLLPTDWVIQHWRTFPSGWAGIRWDHLVPEWTSDVLAQLPSHWPKLAFLQWTWWESVGLFDSCRSTWRWR